MKTNLLKSTKALFALGTMMLTGLASIAQTSVYDVISGSANHTLITAAIDQEGLDVTLDDQNATFTVFAPDDASVNAFLNETNQTTTDFLNNPNLSDIILYHVLGTEVASSAISNGQIVTPENNANTLKLTLDGGSVYVNQGMVNAPDLGADNGVVHSINDVLLPNETVADIAIDSPNHTVLVDAVIEARLLPALTDPLDTMTVFAPDDAAFTEALDSLNITANDLLASPDLADILLYHVLGAEVVSGDLSNGMLAQPLNSANTAKVTITGGGDVYINHAQVTTPDVSADNGVVHVLDQVILPVQTTADIAINSGSHTTLVAAVIEARLLPALTNPFDTLTIFAPDDAAFTESLNDLGITANDLLADPGLANILLYHVLGAEVVSGDLANGSLVTPLNNANTIKVTVTGGGDVYANQAQVTAADNQAENGVVHVLNEVIFTNETVVDAAIDNQFNVLAAAVATAELLPALSDPFEEYTVFAPTDAAFTQYLTDEGITAQDLLNDPNLADILLYHTLGLEVMSMDLTNGPVTTLNGDDVVIDLSNGVMVNDASVITADVDVDNGVVHAIDYVLDPSVANIENETMELIEVYPNPAAEAIKVKNVENATYEIVNMAGATVKSGAINDGTIEVNNLEEGTYFINLKDETTVYRARFIKM